MNFLYAFLVQLDTGVYKLVGWIYQLYMVIAGAKVFDTDIFETFLNRIYIILGIVMLFFLAYSLLRSISDPDSMIKGEASMGKIISNTVISLVIIAILPTIFNFLYDAQATLLKENVIGKIILGNYSSSPSNLQVSFDEKTCEKLDEISEEDNGTNESTDDITEPCKKLYKGQGDTTIQLAGNSIAVDIYSAFFYPTLSEERNSKDNDSEYDEKITEAIEEAEKLGEDPETYEEANQFYNKKFSYTDIATFNNSLSLKDSETKLSPRKESQYKRVASYGPCHTMADGYAYGSSAALCSYDVFATMEDNTFEEVDYKSFLQYAKTTGDFGVFKLLSGAINEGEMEYFPVVTTIAGIFVLYIFASYCIDMGLRAVKLAFAQLVAPVPLLARIVPSQKKIFDSWWKFTAKSYFEVFMRVAIIFLGIFMITNLPQTFEHIFSDSLFSKIFLMSIKTPLILDIGVSWGVKSFARVVVIIGILMFIKQAPELINQSLGISVNAGSLNIRDKIRNNMLGGQIVAKGMDKIDALPGKSWGAISGSVGAALAAKINKAETGDIKAAALNGMKKGFKTGGGQFRNQYQDTYAAFSGDHKYSGSYFHEGRSLTEEIKKSIDDGFKQASVNYDARNNDIRGRFEQSEEFAKTLEQVRENSKQIVNKMEQQEEFQNLYKKQQQYQAEDLKQKHGITSEQLKEIEKNYKAYVEDLVNRADKNTYAAAGVKNEDEYRKLLEKAIKNAGTKTENEQMAAYIDYMDKAKSETRRLYSDRSTEYKKALEGTSDTINSTITKAANDILKQGSADAKEYVRAIEELDNKGKAKSNASIEANLKNMFEQMGYEKKDNK